MFNLRYFLSHPKGGFSLDWCLQGMAVKCWNCSGTSCFPCRWWRHQPWSSEQTGLIVVMRSRRSWCEEWLEGHIYKPSDLGPAALLGDFWSHSSNTSNCDPVFITFRQRAEAMQCIKSVVPRGRCICGLICGAEIRSLVLTSCSPSVPCLLLPCEVFLSVYLCRLVITSSTYHSRQTVLKLLSLIDTIKEALVRLQSTTLRTPPISEVTHYHLDLPPLETNLPASVLITVCNIINPPRQKQCYLWSLCANESSVYVSESQQSACFEERSQDGWKNSLHHPSSAPFFISFLCC